jgi:SAM-dependent methyltransferase
MTDKRTDVGYYDEVYSKSDVTLETSPRLRLYDFVAKHIEPTDVVLDLGCGSGLLAQRLHEKGVMRYIGIDFSTVGLQQASVRCPWAIFLEGDLPEAGEAYLRQHTPSVVTLVEVLEHLVADRRTVAMLPLGMRVVITVPTFDSAAHVRVFETRASLVARYADLLRFDHIEPIGRWWAAVCVRHSPSIAQQREDSSVG